MNRGGGFAVANTHGIGLSDGKEDMSLIASEVDGKICRMNDAAGDPRGRFWAGSCFYNPSGNYPLACLIRVDTDGRTAVMDEGIHLANGIAFSPDESQLYFTDSAARHMYRCGYNVQTGETRNRSALVRVPLNEGVSDGLAVDSASFLWSAEWYGSCVVRYDPDGKVERRIPTPAKQTSSIAFGGADFTDLFITSAAKSYVSPLMPASYDPDSGYFGGRLYHSSLGIPGKPEFKANLLATKPGSKVPKPKTPAR